jgi:hypothetical protein
MDERMCQSCGQIYPIGMFYFSRGICDYCWAMLGLDYDGAHEDVELFGTIPSAGNMDRWVK